MIDWTETGVSVTADWWTLGLWVGLSLSIPFSGWVILRAWRRDRKQPTLAWTHVWAISIERVQDWFGIRKADKAASTLLTLILIIFATLFVSALIASFILLWDVILPSAPTDPALLPTSSQSLGLGTLLVALLGGPFLIWRSVVAQRTLDVQSASLFNQKIQDASQQLHARREVTRKTGRGASAKILVEWEDDQLAQLVAIERLESLGMERPDEAIRIIRVLSTYARHASQTMMRPSPVPNFENSTIQEVREWISQLPTIKEDVLQAIKSAARLNTVVQEALEGAHDGIIDLRDAILPRAALKGLDLRGAVFDGAFLCGANFRESKLGAASFKDTEMLYANFVMARLGQRARFQRSNLIWSDFHGAIGESAYFVGSKLQRASFYNAILPASYFQHARCKLTQFQESTMQRAILLVNDPAELLLQGAILDGAQLSLDKMKDGQLTAAQRASLATMLLAPIGGE